jgi:hypothetical protein
MDGLWQFSISAGLIARSLLCKGEFGFTSQRGLIDTGSLLQGDFELSKLRLTGQSKLFHPKAIFAEPFA